MNAPRIGIVIPAYNEQECLPRLRDRLRSVLDRLGCPYDVYLIDDGSSDRTPQVLRRFAHEDPRWHGVFLSRNFGHQAAVTAGLAVAAGDVVIVMDGDLQDDPEAIPRMLEQYRNGFDVVYAVRARRKEGPVLRLAYWLFYRLLHGMSQTRIPMDSGDFCLMSRRVVDALNSLPENNRFVRGLRAWVGFQQTGITVERGARAAGEPKYTLSKLLRLATDGILDFSWVPLRAVSVAGFLSVAVSLIYLTVIVAMKLLHRVDIQGWTTVVFLTICFGGMILVALGIIGEYLGRIYAEVKRRPTHIIASTTDDVATPPAVSFPAASDELFESVFTSLRRPAPDRGSVSLPRSLPHPLKAPAGR
jgi:polyisoprenyl-phosphate glycosyltransferase